MNINAEVSLEPNLPDICSETALLGCELLRTTAAGAFKIKAHGKVPWSKSVLCIKHYFGFVWHVGMQKTNTVNRGDSVLLHLDR